MLGAVDRSAPMLGRLVGAYCIERKLGQGGMGAVYLAKHTRLPNTFAAVKILLDDSDNARLRFEQEALVAAEMGDHRVVRPLDFGQLEDGTSFILMEYVAGRDLAAVIRDTGPLPVSTALKIAYRIADTLAAAHQRSIIHRDVKPQNIMITDDGGVKVLDFGVARASGEMKRAETAARAVIGTPGYMSPEAATALGVDGRSDVFSLGVVLYQMLTGSLPFLASHDPAGIIDLLTSNPPRIFSRRPAHCDPVPDAVELLVSSALVKEPRQRPTMAALQHSLHDWVAKSTAEPVSMLSEASDEAIHQPTLSDRTDEVSALLRRLAAESPPAGPSTPPELSVLPTPQGKAVTPVPVAKRGVGRLRTALLLGAAAAAGLGFFAYRSLREHPPATPPSAVQRVAVSAPPPIQQPPRPELAAPRLELPPTQGSASTTTGKALRKPQRSTPRLPAAKDPEIRSP